MNMADEAMGQDLDGTRCPKRTLGDEGEITRIEAMTPKLLAIDFELEGTIPRDFRDSNTGGGPGPMQMSDQRLKQTLDENKQLLPEQWTFERNETRLFTFPNACSGKSQFLWSVRHCHDLEAGQKYDIGTEEERKSVDNVRANWKASQQEEINSKHSKIKITQYQTCRIVFAGCATFVQVISTLVIGQYDSQHQRQPDQKLNIAIGYWRIRELLGHLGISRLPELTCLEERLRSSMPEFLLDPSAETYVNAQLMFYASIVAFCHWTNNDVTQVHILMAGIALGSLVGGALAVDDGSFMILKAFLPFVVVLTLVVGTCARRMMRPIAQ